MDELWINRPLGGQELDELHKRRGLDPGETDEEATDEWWEGGLRIQVVVNAES